MEQTRTRLTRLTFAGHDALHSSDTLLALTIRATDAFWLTASLWLACAAYPQEWSNREGTAAALAVALFHILGHAQGLHRPLARSSWFLETKRVWLCWAMVTPLLLGLGFFTKTTESYSRVIMTTWFLLAPALVSASRVGLRTLVNRAHARGYNTRTVAIAGATELAEELARNITHAPWLGMKVVGYYDDRRAPRAGQPAVPSASLKGNFNQLVVAARSGAVDLVYIAMPLRAERRINAIIRDLQDTTASVYLACDFGGVDVLRAEWSQIGNVPAMSVVESPFQGIDGLAKRIEDLVLASALLVLSVLPMALIAVAVALGSKGPVLVRERRCGLHGEAMHVLKFRTTRSLPDGTVEVTPLGRWLRRTALEELPQLYQVLAGEMSIVGPRPHSALHDDRFGALILGYTMRQRVKPGMTGWAQVHGWRVESDTLDHMQRRIEYDLAYIRHWALSVDLKILWLTLRCLVSGKSVS